MKTKTEILSTTDPTTTCHLGHPIDGGRAATTELLRSGAVIYAHNPDPLRAELDRLHLDYETSVIEVDNTGQWPRIGLFGQSERGTLFQLVR